MDYVEWKHSPSLPVCSAPDMKTLMWPAGQWAKRSPSPALLGQAIREQSCCSSWVLLSTHAVFKQLWKQGWNPSPAALSVCSVTTGRSASCIPGCTMSHFKESWKILSCKILCDFLVFSFSLGSEYSPFWVVQIKDFFLLDELNSQGQLLDFTVKCLACTW